MPGKISFHFDDGTITHYTDAYRIFKEEGVVGCLALMGEDHGTLTFKQALEMQDNGWEILSHSIRHLRIREAMSDEDAYSEIVESKKLLEAAGFRVRQFVTPCSQAHPKFIPLIAKTYDAAYTRYKQTSKCTTEELMAERPVDPYALHRTGLGTSMERLYEFVDAVCDTDGWMTMYEHQIGEGKNITADNLRLLVRYIKEKGVRIVTSSQAIDEELAR